MAPRHFERIESANTDAFEKNPGVGPNGELTGDYHDTPLDGPDWKMFKDPNFDKDQGIIANGINEEKATPIQKMGTSTFAGPQVDNTQSNQTREQQQALAEMLRKQANGEGASAAQATLQQGTDKGIASSLAIARSGRGGSQAMKQALANNAGIQQGSAANAAVLRAGEIQSAQQALGGVLSGVRGQDQQGAQFQTGIDLKTAEDNQTSTNFANSTNLTSAVNQQQFIDNQLLKYRSLGMTLDQAQSQAMKDYETLRVQTQTQRYGIDKNVAIQTGNQAAQTTGTVLATIGAIAAGAASMASDKELKTNIKPADSQQLMDALKAFEYEYKDEKHGEGRRAGIMAQDAEKSRLGKAFVMNTPEGKMIDVNKALSAALANEAQLNERVKKLEGKKK